VKAYYVGIDEAGRGPVLGDMVVAGVASTPGVFEDLARLGVRDSKLLSPSRRLSLYKSIISQSAVVVVVYIPPIRLDRENLNTLEEKAVVRILSVVSRAISENVSEISVFIDEIKGRRANIENSIRGLFQRPVNVIMEPHADSKYTPVAAASIVAKVSRDLNLKTLRSLLGDFGSGYITDPSTKRWVLDYYASHREPPLFIRRSWRALRDLAPLWYTTKKRRSSGKSLLDYVKRGDRD
jgi:ribonuclease HII